MHVSRTDFMEVDVTASHRHLVSALQATTSHNPCFVCSVNTHIAPREGTQVPSPLLRRRIRREGVGGSLEEWTPVHH
jgi:phosphoribosyl-dephospho-CoA transferase